MTQDFSLLSQQLHVVFLFKTMIAYGIRYQTWKPWMTRTPSAIGSSSYSFFLGSSISPGRLDPTLYRCHLQASWVSTTHDYNPHRCQCVEALRVSQLDIDQPFLEPKKGSSRPSLVRLDTFWSAYITAQAPLRIMGKLDRLSITSWSCNRNCNGTLSTPKMPPHPTR